ncbi:hypothetical protein RF11_00396 [Thelohanellus kitauei]|uniref:RRM domain-containing protein n=1 Tax=Thelohanellus kitauei TaxID=669202 RepID=A0A0C2IW25_THEKT|nr:hypothetical protein RF11_00396 [Thelohanellus kitauei]
MNPVQQLQSFTFDAKTPHEPIRTLFVSQIPLTCTVQDIHKIFQSCSGFEKVVMYENPKGQGKYIDAFVSFDTPENAEKALNEFNNKPVNDGEYFLEICFARQNTRRSGSNWNKKYPNGNFSNMPGYVQAYQTVQNVDGSYILVPNSYFFYPNYVLCQPFVYYCNMPHWSDPS